MNDKFHLECAQENIQTADRWLYWRRPVRPLIALTLMGALMTLFCLGQVLIASWFAAAVYGCLALMCFITQYRCLADTTNRIAECRKELGYARDRLNWITKDKLQ